MTEEEINANRSQVVDSPERQKRLREHPELQKIIEEIFGIIPAYYDEREATKICKLLLGLASRARGEALAEAAKIAENGNAEYGWNGHYFNQGLAVAAGIRRLKGARVGVRGERRAEVEAGGLREREATCVATGAGVETLGSE